MKNSKFNQSIIIIQMQIESNLNLKSNKNSLNNKSRISNQTPKKTL
jgi:hypothetical protein